MLNCPPSFRGRHNEVRSKCWLVLLDRYLAGDRRGLSARELAEHTGVSVSTLYVLLGRWYRWCYVLRNDHTEPVTWKIASRGRRWLDRWHEVMPLTRYLEEIESHQALNRPALHKLKRVGRPRSHDVKSHAVSRNVKSYALIGDGGGHHGRRRYRGKT